MMVFDYTKYFEKVFILPIAILLIVMVDLLFLLYRQRNSSKYHISKIELFLQIIGIVVLSIVSVTQLRFGIILDNEQSTQTITGEISCISDVDLPPRYYRDNKRVWPKLIEINDETFYIMSIGEYELNDKVVIEYLPNSKLVISITEDDN